MARSEVRLVGMRVPDSGQHRDLALAVERGDRAQLRVPEQARVLGEGLAGRGIELERGSEPPVIRVEPRVEQGERVRAAGQEDGDEHGLGGPGRRARDPLLEEPELAEAVHGEREAEAARDERPPVEAGAGRQRHPRLDRGQAASRLGRSPSDQRGPRELLAVVAGAGHQQV